MKRTRKLTAIVIAATIYAGVAPQALGDARVTAGSPASAAGRAEVVSGWRLAFLRWFGFAASGETTRVSEAVQVVSPSASTAGEPTTPIGAEDEAVVPTNPADSGGDVGPDWDPNG